MKRISQQIASSFQSLLARHNIIDTFMQGMSSHKMTCSICLDDNLDISQMFCVNKCRHQFCSNCVKRHIELRLFEGSVIRCPHYRCKSKLTFGSCVDILTPELRKTWNKRIKEDKIPITDRIYCPNPTCAALMSIKKLSKPIKQAGVRRYFSTFTTEARFRRHCFECFHLLCINCRVPWHSDLSCNDYMKLDPNSTAGDRKLKALANQRLWRQCGKCNQMIELSEGCIKVICRCGHRFCYKCGAKAGDCDHHFYNIFPTRPSQQ
ncbi:PREDICTED: probable E3 ubiquitin-protein ligase RNF144A-A [Camelina sativa]|uniref:RBR-type E3 ubiquitin transferase n=1 Tax=Camelina sativa TaxID=90675 RepID=A0ABM1RS73_CAMSA|nr:PREDICTED: probable E3 ubiquitin-protein ligase RNF144A-A [Camelina sativa]